MATAAKRRELHTTYGNVAYDTARFRVGGAAEVRRPHLQEMPLVRPRRKSRQQIQTRVRVNLRPKEAYSPLPAVGLLAVAFMAVLIVFSLGQLTSIYTETSQTRDELTVLRQEEGDLRAEYERVFDHAVLSEAVSQARAEGAQLAPARSDQIIYFDLSEPDNAVLYDNAEASPLEQLRELWAALTGA